MEAVPEISGVSEFISVAEDTRVVRNLHGDRGG